jgi:hypothetical protein
MLEDLSCILRLVAAIVLRCKLGDWIFSSATDAPLAEAKILEERAHGER